MRQLIAGNWKMNGRLEDGTALVTKLRSAADGLECDVLICPPATLLLTLSAALTGSPVMIGAQDCHTKPSGAHTGDLSAPMIRDAGASWVILGHSERRTDHGETDALVQAKIRAAVAANLIPIVCVGETEAERVAGRQSDVVGAQIVGSLPTDFSGVVAYEPVSVQPSNAAALMALPEVGGALVGGASLVADDFLAIAHASHAVATATRAG